MKVCQWPALGKWTCKHLKKAFHQKPVIVGEYPMDFDEYLAYMAMNTDEMPLYLFDKHFADKAPSLAHDYQVTWMMPSPSARLRHVPEKACVFQRSKA